MSLWQVVNVVVLQIIFKSYSIISFILNHKYLFPSSFLSLFQKEFFFCLLITLCLSCSACLTSTSPALRDPPLRSSNQSAWSFVHLQLDLYAVSFKLSLSGYVIKVVADKNCPINLRKDDKEQEKTKCISNWLIFSGGGLGLAVNVLLTGLSSRPC